MCRNWELYGYCDFNENVNKLLIIILNNSVPLHMEHGSCKGSSMCLRTTKQSSANSIMRTYIALMVSDASSSIPNNLRINQGNYHYKMDPLNYPQIVILPLKTTLRN